MPETALRTAARIRQEFLDFFARKHGHVIVPSSPVVPHDDPTLLFANAGMNQFKDIFLGYGNRGHTRVVNTQKCIRAGGKHNDLEDVGKDLYHHTFFEMLGNWSFGDYFKAEAIEWAWDLLTNVWGLDKNRLYATVFGGDEREGLEPDLEAEELWKRHTDIDPSHISRWGKKDNFWEMGETGPCGPCSEIHYDDRPLEALGEKSGRELVNADDPNVIEIWNLVFIQFNRDENGVLAPLPARHVDTGMGFERLVRVLQGRKSNYDIDIWRPIFDAICECASVRPYAGRVDAPIDMAYRIIADHARCLTVAITDGAIPSNEGRGYVLRRILRRGVRVARQTMGATEPILCRLVPAVVQSLSDAFPELENDPDRVADIIRSEEEGFLRTLDRGLVLFSEAAVRGLMKAPLKSERWSIRQSYEQGAFHVRIADADGELVTEDAVSSITPMWSGEYFARPPEISAGDVFKLHDTYGFPVDLTRVMAEERGMTVDEVGYQALMEEARERSRLAGATDSATLQIKPLPPTIEAPPPPTEDIDKYHGRTLTARVTAIWDGEGMRDSVESGPLIGVVLNRTNHYAEQGGQVGDQGWIIADHDSDEPTGAFDVQDTRLDGGHIVHLGRVADGVLRVGDRVTVRIDHDRRQPIRANHTATHLLNHALREVVGEEIEQRGSLVAEDRLRFDFTCSGAMTPEQIEEVEDRVNRAIQAGKTVYSDIVPLEKARGINGLRAVFGERYPDPVRTVCIGRPISDLLEDPANPGWSEYPIELCGGTHLESTGEAGQFVLVQEQALAAGVRRITALTGQAAREADAAGRDLELSALDAAELSARQLPEEVDRISRLADELTISAVRKRRVLTFLEPLRERIKEARKQSQVAARGAVVEQARTLVEKTEGEVIVSCLLGADKETLRSAMDAIRAKRPDAATMLFAGDEIESKVSIIASVPEAIIARGLKAGDWVKLAAEICGGGGGGRPDSAQAGGKDPARISEAIAQAREFAERMLR
ncbi:MAG: alanine--tRNA ligase [Phycisphaerales bacterium]|nr:MAG: alanine--tRNA ligase [Phycisphaerales bacterium]